MDSKTQNEIAKKVVKLLMKQTDRDKVVDVEGMSLSLSSVEKKTLSSALTEKYKGYKVNGTFKIEKTWTNQVGKTTTKEFNGVELEKDGVVKKPLFVKEGHVLSVWN